MGAGGGRRHDAAWEWGDGDLRSNRLCEWVGDGIGISMRLDKATARRVLADGHQTGDTADGQSALRGGGFAGVLAVVSVAGWA